MRLLRLAVLLPLLVLSLAGCGATPVFLGNAEDGATCIARLTEFRVDAGASRILHALGGAKEAEAAGCQFSMRGGCQDGAQATLHAGDCRAALGMSEPEPEPEAEFDDIWIPPLR